MYVKSSTLLICHCTKKILWPFFKKKFKSYEDPSLYLLYNVELKIWQVNNTVGE